MTLKIDLGIKFVLKLKTLSSSVFPVVQAYYFVQEFFVVAMDSRWHGKACVASNTSATEGTVLTPQNILIESAHCLWTMSICHTSAAYMETSGQASSQGWEEYKFWGFWMWHSRHTIGIEIDMCCKSHNLANPVCTLPSWGSALTGTVLMQHVVA